MEELIKQIQEGFNALSGNFLEKLSAQAELIEKYAAPVLEKEFKDWKVLDSYKAVSENFGEGIIEKIKNYAKSLVPAEGLTFDELLDLIGNITDADKLKAKFFEGATNELSKAATKTAAEILKGGLNED